SGASRWRRVRFRAGRKFHFRRKFIQERWNRLSVVPPWNTGVCDTSWCKLPTRPDGNGSCTTPRLKRKLGSRPTSNLPFTPPRELSIKLGRTKGRKGSESVRGAPGASTRAHLQVPLGRPGCDGEVMML